MPTTHDFEPILRAACHRVRPDNVLEWGPGLSTSIIHEECPDARILSIEHDTKYYERAVKEHGEYAEVRLLRVFRSGGPSRYSSWPLLHAPGPYGLIFIDGRRRVECLLVASHVLAPGGEVLVHDAGRAEYQHGLDLFDRAGGDERTVVLKAGRP